MLNHCDVSEEVQLRSKIHSFCSELQKDGNTSPYLLSTIMDLDKDEGLKNKDIAKLENALQVIWIYWIWVVEIFEYKINLLSEKYVNIIPADAQAGTLFP